MEQLKALLGRLDGWQQRHRSVAVAWAVQRKYSNDNASLLVVALGWYGFTAIYPLLLAVTTVLGFVGVRSLGTRVVSALHHFPVIGSQFSVARGAHDLHGSLVGLVIGLVGLVYGAQGVTQSAQSAMNRVWNVPDVDRPNFLPRLGRSLAALAAIGFAFLANALAGGLATSGGPALWLRAVIVAGQLVVNVGLYLLVFRLLLAPKAEVGTRRLLPGAVLGGIAFSVLITVGTGLVTHELRNESATYGAFASVIGVVTFLLLLAKLSIYAAELNPVLDRRLYPRALPGGHPLDADRRAAAARAAEARQRADEKVLIDFGAAAGQADHAGGQADHAGGKADHAGGQADHAGGKADHAGAGQADHAGGQGVGAQ